MSAKKKKIIKAFIIIGVVIAVLFAAVKILENVAVMDDELPEFDYEFYVPAENEETNIYLDKEYMELDRALYYTDDMGQCSGITDPEKENNRFVTFFWNFFDHLEKGDADSFNKLFSEELGKYESFGMQRVYRKNVTYMNEGKVDENTYYMTFCVTYCIMKNDGSFRRDIGSDMSRTQYMTVYYNNSKEWIADVTTVYKK